MQSKSVLLTFGIVLGVFVAGVGYMYFVGASNKQEPSATPQVEQAIQTKEITVTGTEYAFSPDALTVNKGEQVKLIFVNNGKLAHNITVDELSLATSIITQGQQTSLEFTAEKTGSFKMYCSVGNHRVLGMEGMMEVK